MNKNNVNNQNKRSPLGQAWHVGTYPFKKLGSILLPVMAMFGSVQTKPKFQHKELRDDSGNLIREGLFFVRQDGKSDNFYNPYDMCWHNDVVKFKVNFDHEMIKKMKKKPSNINPTEYVNPDIVEFTEQKRYDTCSQSGYFLYKRQLDGKMPKNIKREKINGHTHLTLDENDKKEILKEVNNKYKKLKQCLLGKNVDTIAFEFIWHASEDSTPAYTNLGPKDFSNIFKSAMKDFKKIYVTDAICLNVPDMIDTLKAIAKENNYSGDIIVRRNGQYDKKFLCGFEIDKFGNTNSIYFSPEFVHIKNGEEKRISENQARKILGGSYKENLKYNKSHKIGNVIRNKELNKRKKQPQYDTKQQKPNNGNSGTGMDTCDGKDDFLHDIE